MGGLGGLVGPTLGPTLGAPGAPSAPLLGPPPSTLAEDPLGVVGRVADNVASLAEQRRLQLRALVRANRQLLDLDEHGQPVVRGEVLAVSPSPRSLGLARQAGFTLADEEPLEGLGISLVVLRAPEGVSAKDAVKRLRKLDPGGSYDYDHLYSVSGRAAPGAASPPPTGPSPGAGVGLRLGLVDGGVDAGHPALAGARIERKAFAPGGLVARVHGTAVASLMVGQQGPFHGAAPGAALFAADVYGSTPAGGAADAVVRALGWLSQSRVQVINISLVGPPNAALEAAVRALRSGGVLVVAAVGNDGPAAPPLYPAGYPQVIAATAVDAHNKALMEAGRGTHVDFAAPGADMAAAGPGESFATVRGTSFAAPIVAGELALQLRGEGPQAAADAVERLGREATDLGPKGPDRTYGRGLVGARVRTPPREVGTKGPPIS